MKLLQIIGTLDPAFGGPAEACRQINMSLSKLGHRGEVLTLDGTDVPWIADFPDVVHALGPSTVKYRYNKQLINWLRTHLNNYDVVLVHCVWQFQSFATWFATRRNSVPYFVFVHGALDPWFKRAYPFKHIKKRIYWTLSEYRVLRDAKAVLFTCDDERVLAGQSFGLNRVNEAIVDFGIPDPGGEPLAQREQFLQRNPALRNKRLLLFLSRIQQKKGCDLLMEAFARVAARDPALHLVMAGPDQEGWQQKLIALAKARGVGDRITWTGMLTGDMKWGAFHAADIFLLPSHSENFGIVLAEALACGLPVLITDKVNIWREIVQDGAGFAEPDSLDGTVALLERWLGLTADEIRQMRNRARTCFENHFEILRSTKKLISVIEPYLLVKTGKAVPSGSVAVQECNP